MKLEKKVVRGILAAGAFALFAAVMHDSSFETAYAKDASGDATAYEQTYGDYLEAAESVTLGITRSTDGVSVAAWATKAMADVDDYVNIREEASKDSEVVGRLRKGDIAEVIKTGKKWTKISSGEVEGYVKTDFLVFGDEAYELAQEVCDYEVTVSTDALRIRKKASTDSEILGVVEEGDTLVIRTGAKVHDGWIAVEYNGEKAWVCSDYVKTGLGTGTAMTAEEIEKEESLSSERFLLAAIIMCEAGGESYEGQVAVGAVVLNRVESSAYPDTISGVIYQSGQFGPVSNGSLASKLSGGTITQSCFDAADAALSGTDNVYGALSFCRKGSKSGIVIGNHVFY